MERKIKFNARVICEYMRHWDTHSINEEMGKLTDSVIEEIIDSSAKIEYGYENEFKSSFSFAHYTNNSLPEWIKKSLDRDSESSIRHLFNKGYLVLQSEVEFTEDQYRSVQKYSDGSPVEEGGFTDADRINFYKHFVLTTLSDYAFIFSLSANVAKPGSLQVHRRYLFSDKDLIETAGGTLNCFDNSYSVSEKYSWPPIKNIPVFDVWEWMLSIPGFTSGETKTDLGRAVGALSYLLNDDFKDGNELSLVWALVGLETLYGNGNVGLKSQLLDKTEAFLGKRTSLKKDFGQMYDFRSRLIHGDKNFHYNGYDGVLEKEYTVRVRDSQDLAATTLISTLQKMCLGSMQEISFRVVAE